MENKPQFKPKLSRPQKQMMNWIDAGKLLIVKGNKVFVSGQLAYIGRLNTLESLERLGLVEKVIVKHPVRFVYYQKPTFVQVGE